MISGRSAENAGPVQEIVHEGVDGDQGDADLTPLLLAFGAASKTQDRVIAGVLSATP